MSQIMSIVAVLYSDALLVLGMVALLLVATVLIVILLRKRPEQIDFTEADKDAVAIEPIWESDSALTESEKKQITRVVSSGAFRRMRDEVQK